MSKRGIISMGVALATTLMAGEASATDISGNTTMSAIQASVSGDGIINFTANATLTMNQDGTAVTTISVANGITAVIDMGSGANNYRLIFANAAAAITLNGNGTLAVTGTDATGGFDFAATASAKTLTITSSTGGTLNSAVNGNRLILGNGNTVTFTVNANTDALHIVAVTGAGTVDVDDDLTIKTLTITASQNLDINVAQGKTATVTDAATISGTTILEMISDSTSGADTLAFTGGLTIGAAGAKIQFTNDTGAVTGGITINGGDGSVIDVDGTTTIDTVTPTNSTNIQVAAGKSLTITNQVVVPTTKILTFTGTNDASAETLTVTGGIQLNGSTAEFNITGDTTTAMVVAGTVTANVDGAVLDIDAPATITAVAMTAGSGNLTLQVAANTLTVTNGIDVNDNTLTITEAGAGTISLVTLDTATGIVDLNTAKTITALTASNTSGSVTLQNGATLSGTVNLSGAGGTLVIAETGTIAAISLAAAGTLDVNANFTATTVDLAANATVDVANAVTLTATNGVDTNTFAMTFVGPGTISKVDIDGAAGIVRMGSAAGTITTITHTAAGEIDLDTNTSNLTVTNDIVTGNQKLTLRGSGAGGQETLTATIDLSGGTSAELEIVGANVDNIIITEIDVSVNGATVDANISFAPTLIDMNAAAGDLNLELASGTTLTGNVDINDNRVTIKETGTITTVTADTVNGIVDVDASMTINALTNSQNFQINIASGVTLTNTLDIVARTLTLSGPGTITRVDGTTPTITNNGGTTISDFRATFGSGGTVIWNGTGAGTITTMANALPGASETLQKDGSGSLTITSGITTAFANAAGVVLDINGGEVKIGVAGTNDNITFDDDADEITIASGATLTTYGTFVVGAAGANVNLDAALGSTVNLSGASGAETFTASANDDYNMLGTVNINGSNGDYTISDAFDYKFGSMTINSAGSLINSQANGEMRFVAGSTITLNGDATFTANGQATGTRLTMNTTSGSGTFTINRGTSTNMTIQNVSLSNAAYAGNDGADCALTLTGVDFVTGDVNWSGGCASAPPPSGSDPNTTDTTDTTTTDNTTGDTTTDTTTDVTDVTDSTPTTDGEPTTDAEPVPETTTDTDGTAVVSDGTTDATVEGLEEGTAVLIESTENGDSTLTIGDPDDPDLVVMVEGMGTDAELELSIDSEGDQTLGIRDKDGASVMTITTIGLGTDAVISIAIDDTTQTQVIFLQDASGATVRLDLANMPHGADIVVTTADDGSVLVTVVDTTGELAGVVLDASDAGENVVFSITYDEAPTIEATGRRIPGFPGLENEESFGGAVTIAATGMTETSIITVMLQYEDSDLTGIDETKLRLHRFNAETGIYVPAASNDAGAVPPTGVLDDLGVDLDTNSAWAEVSTLGTFVVGIKDTSQLQVVDGSSNACGSGGGLCGAMGVMALPLTALGLFSMRRRNGRYSL